MERQPSKGLVRGKDVKKNMRYSYIQKEEEQQQQQEEEEEEEKFVYYFFIRFIVLIVLHILFVIQLDYLW